MTKEQNAAIMYAQYHLRLAVLQLERDLGTNVAAPMSAAMRAAIQVCDDAMRPPCERKPPRAWLLLVPAVFVVASVIVWLLLGGKW